MKKFLLFLISVFILSPVSAEENIYDGVWKGSIGNGQVYVCLSGSGSNYYYTKHLRGISISPNDDFSQWVEFEAGSVGVKETGKWQIHLVESEKIEGTWSSLKGGKDQQIRLKKIADLQRNNEGNPEYAPCGVAFYRKIEEGEPIQIPAMKTKYATAFQLPSSFAGAKAFNSYVRNWLNEQTVNVYQCHLGGGKKDFQRELSQLVLNRKILVVMDMIFDTYCGDAYNTSSIEYRIYDPQTGQKIDTWSWIKDGAASAEQADSPKKRSGLRKLIEKNNPAAVKHPGEVNGCDANFDVYQPFPTKEGFEFPIAYSTAARACNTSATIPYASLMPYLTQSGKSVAKTFVDSDK